MRSKIVAAGLFALAAFATGSFAYADEAIEYTYDAKGRLVAVVYCGADEDCDATSDNTDVTYEYDDADNRTEKDTDTPP